MTLRRGNRVELRGSRDAADRLRSGSVVGVQKFVPIELETVKRDAGELQQVSFIISDESKDRYGDTISADGWDFEAYAKNPVLLWAHDYSLPPVGKMGTPWKTVGKKVKAVVDQFTPVELNPMGAAVEGMIRKGFLNAVSVGFQPVEFTFNDDYSVNYVKQELLEISVVPVPANANALVAAKSAGLWVPEMQRWVEKQLDTKAAGLAYQFAQDAFAALRSPMVQVPRGADLADDDEPLPEIVELKSSVDTLTTVMLEVLAEVRADRAERRAERLAAKVAAELTPSTPTKF